MLSAKNTFASAPSFTDTQPLTIGMGGAYLFNGGSMDEVALYNKALTGADIRQHYLQGTQFISGSIDGGFC